MKRRKPERFHGLSTKGMGLCPNPHLILFLNQNLEYNCYSIPMG